MVEKSLHRLMKHNRACDRDRMGKLLLPKSTVYPEKAIVVGVEEDHGQEWWPLVEDAVIPQPSPQTGE